MSKLKMLFKYGKYIALPFFAIAAFVGYCIMSRNFLLFVSPLVIFIAVLGICDFVWERIKIKYPLVTEMIKPFKQMARDIYRALAYKSR